MNKATAVPDTLDLAERGRMAINGVLGSLNPERGYECAFLTFFDANPPYMLHWSSMVSGVMPKYVEALPMLRLMSGSRDQMDLQEGFMSAMLDNMHGDGLVYDRMSPERPWNTGIGYGEKEWNEDYACLAGNGRLLAGLTWWHQATGDDEWKRRAGRAAERMLELAIVRGDEAWYPNPGLGNDFSYPRISGWTTTEPPKGPKEGYEGATMFYHLQPLRGFVPYFRLSGDERFLELSRKFAKLGMEQKFWGAANDLDPSAGGQRGHFDIHVHAMIAPVRGLLDYALAAGDERAKAFARDSYEWARQMGVPRLGLFPNTPCTGSEGCTGADMVALAIALSDAGLGDYWDDVEQYARNGLVESQMTDAAEMLRVAQAGSKRQRGEDWTGPPVATAIWDDRLRTLFPGQDMVERVAERSVGAFGFVLDASRMEMLMHCCTANGSQGLYYAWEGIVRRSGESAEVNMWLNRRSPWVDVWSFLPYEGKLAVRNKTMKRIAVRLPGWARRSEVVCRLNGRPVTPVWVGNRMVFDGLSGGEEIEILAPVRDDRAEYTLSYMPGYKVNRDGTSGPCIACRFRGNTAVALESISPRAGVAVYDGYRVFRREHMLADNAPGKPLPQYVHPEKLIAWQR
ncbi:MAG: hypothetical protein ACYTAN_09665 [Planctomycetota bacterium]|jgi:hypothetical protein